MYIYITSNNLFLIGLLSDEKNMKQIIFKIYNSKKSSISYVLCGKFAKYRNLNV